jgi:hypothetical protein
MRLFERVVVSRPMLILRQPDGTRLRLADVGAKRDVINQCPVRYVLDDDASVKCLSEVLNIARTFDPANPLLRMPAPVMWIEMRGCLDGLAANTVGFLIESDEEGRAGTITTYLADDGAQPKLVVMRTVFDLDERIAMRNLPLMTRRLIHADFRHLDSLFAHIIGEVEETWRPVIARKRGSDRQDELGRLGNACWFALPAVLVFIELLDQRALRNASTDGAPSGKARALAVGPGPLSSHIEVTLTLEPDQARHHHIDHTARSAARPHHVRGHLVNRGGKVFWRSSHSRCAGSGAAIPKVVTVRQGRRSG